YAEAHNNLGLVQRNLGQLPEAIASHERAIALKPPYPEALNNLATALRESGRLEDALAACERALAAKPDFAQALNNRGATLHQMGRHAEALAAIDRAIALAPELATAHFNRGVVLGDLGRHEDSLPAYERALQLNPRHPTAWNNLGFAMQALHREEEALRCFGQALALEPDNVEARVNQGNALHELRRLPEAIEAFEQALARAPGHVGAWTNKGIALADAARWDEAQAAFDRVCQLHPGQRYALGSRFNAAIRAADWTHFEAWRAELESAVLAGQAAATPFVFLAASDSAHAQLQCARLYAQDQARSFPPLWTGARYGHDKLRVAYLSADFHDHATAHLMAEVFEKHDRSRFEVSAWSFGPVTNDAMQQRMRAAFAQFHEVQLQSDAETARRLHAQEIDIVVDLKGYTQGSRSEILAHRPAPVQVNYLGYPGTMGSPLVDYILADAHTIPPGHEAFYDEKVIRLPGSYQPNCRQREVAHAIPSREALGLPAQGFVFCCFNHGYKITPAVFAVWMRLLRQVEGSVLWLLQDSPLVAERLRQAAQAQGVAPERIVFAPRAPLPEHLARHHLADLFLDTAPVNAHTTASDALWAGLPLLTCSGDSFVSRVAGSLLHAAGVPELVTTSLADYEAAALRLATHPGELAELNQRLLTGRASSALFDSEATTRHLESAFLQMLADA
ncbi:MAG: tetratricopeptide repeat protein, partial [Comamonadaceae bacterium]